MASCPHHHSHAIFKSLAYGRHSYCLLFLKIVPKLCKIWKHHLDKKVAQFKYLSNFAFKFENNPTPGSSVALVWAVQDRDPRKFRRTKEGSTGGLNSRKFKRTKRQFKKNVNPMHDSRLFRYASRGSSGGYKGSNQAVHVCFRGKYT
jgi:hypothetical protein